MTGFNMPPGCNVSDIPGNTPEDQAAEAAYDAIYNELITAKLISTVDTDAEGLVEFILRKMGEAQREGYTQAQADEAMAREIALDKRDSEHYFNESE